MCIRAKTGSQHQSQNWITAPEPKLDHSIRAKTVITSETLHENVMYRYFTYAYIVGYQNGHKSLDLLWFELHYSCSVGGWGVGIHTCSFLSLQLSTLHLVNTAFAESTIHTSHTSVTQLH